MDNRTHSAQNRSSTSLPMDLPEEPSANGESSYGKEKQILLVKHPFSRPPMDGPSNNPVTATNGNDDESNSYFFSEPSVSEDGDSQHIVRAPHRLGGGSGVLGRFGFQQSRQPPRHHRRGNFTNRDALKFHSGSDDDGVFDDNNHNNSSYSNSRSTAMFVVDDSNILHQSTSQRKNNQTEAIEARQRVRQRFINSTSVSPGNTSLSSWEPTSPDIRRKVSLQFVMPESKVAKYDRLKQQGHKQLHLQQPNAQQHQNGYESYRMHQQQPHESIDSYSATREVQSTVRIVEYSQRQRIRQRSQQSFHNYSPSPGSSSMNTGQFHTRNNRVHSLLAESVSPMQLNHTSHFVQSEALPIVGADTQTPEEYYSSRGKRSHSFDTSMSMNISESEAGDIVDYSQYPNRTFDGDGQNSADDEATSNKVMNGKETSKIGHSRCHSTNDTLALGRRRNSTKGSLLMPHNQQRMQPGNASRLRATSSFGSAYDTLSIGAKAMDAGQKSIRESREGLLRMKKVKDIDSNSGDSGSISADEDDHNRPSFQRRNRESSRMRGPSLKRAGKTMSPFANIGKSSAEKAARSTFLPTTYGADDKTYSTFICPRCKTRQREFFTVENAAGRLEGPGSYLALYFAVYVTCSLFIFGLEEGWKPLDCIYFAVITLTTAGLGDFVPTSWVNKIICSIFIYFGVACIGLLLGSYIASMLDHRANADRKDKQIDACPNCARIKTINEVAVARNKATLDAKVKYMTERVSKKPDQIYKSNLREQKMLLDEIALTPSNDEENSRKSHVVSWNNTHFGSAASPAVSNSSTASSRLLGSPVTRQILGRQKHTRHASIDVSTSKLFSGGLPTTYGTSMVKNSSDEMISRRSSSNMDRHGHSNVVSPTRKLRTIASSEKLYEGTTTESDDDSMAMTSSTLSSTEAIWDGTKSQLNAAKYVFVTLRLALFNSMVIIAVGCAGFWLIEGFSLIDSWYFTTVLLTTVGYGDIVPVTDSGKLFATIYILVAGTLLLNNMSSISMIPLELRRRRIERAVLTQFGDHLDDAALRELATGPLIQRLRLSANRTDGLDECTREMFSLAMLVRLGKVTEHDIRGTFSCFRHLDVNNEGVLNSKSIIGGMIAKQRQSTIFMASSHQPPPPPPPPYNVLDNESSDHNLKSVWFGRQGSLHVTTPENSYTFHEHSNRNISDTRINDESLGLPLNDI